MYTFQPTKLRVSAETELHRALEAFDAAPTDAYKKII